MAPTLKFSQGQGDILALYWDAAIWRYFQWRYGSNWRYYWLEWENNRELML